MNQRIFAQLEFETIRSRVAERCIGAEAADLVRSQVPTNDVVELASTKELVDAFARLMDSGVPAPALSFPALSFLLPRLGVEGTGLDLDEAYALGLYAESAGRLAAWLSGEGSYDALRAAAASLPDCSGVAREVFKILDRDGGLRDLPELRAVKRRIQELRRDLEATTSRYFSDDETRRMLQAELPTVRDGRVVLALKANFRGRIRGIVHEVSASGQTVFLEPEDVVERNNDIVMEERRYAQEVARILRELAGRIGERADDLVELVRGTTRLDALRARARYGIETRGILAADATETGKVVLNRARHPLLGSKAVPIDFAMDGATRVVIVTGPNTGGKTVALKTVGLLALMNQFGLPLPAEEGTALPVFDDIFADIGDEQSISQSLSTFSAHMVNMSSVIERATARSLVLLDELGSGTDPEEGSAIAMAILDHFIGTGCRTLVTTHHGILKNYGYSRPGVQNASVDFDARTLSPTYRIVMGVPGESRALEIAARNGLGEDVVAAARGYLDEERADVSELIKGLKTKHRELQEADEARKKKERDLAEEQRRADLKELRLRQRELELRDQGVGSLRRMLDESRKTLENLVRELREGELTREKTVGVKEFLAGLEAAVGRESERLETDGDVLAAERRIAEARGSAAAVSEDDGRSEPGRKRRRKDSRDRGTPGQPVPTAIPERIEPGVEVLVGPSRLRGTVVRADRRGYWIVETGTVRASVRERDLVPTAPAPKAAPEIASVDLSGSSPAAKLELKLLGMRLDEALDALRSQLDAAAMSGLYEFSVIHGKGNGVLQKGVHDYLSAQRTVAEFHYARPEDGGFGKTLVSLKR